MRWIGIKEEELFPLKAIKSSPDWRLQMGTIQETGSRKEEKEYLKLNSSNKCTSYPAIVRRSSSSKPNESTFWATSKRARGGDEEESFRNSVVVIEQELYNVGIRTTCGSNKHSSATPIRTVTTTTTRMWRDGIGILWTHQSVILVKLKEGCRWCDMKEYHNIDKVQCVEGG